MPAQFKKSADGSYDLSGYPEDMQPAIRSLLQKSDEQAVQLATMIEKEDRQAFLSKAAGMTHLPDVKPEDFAEVLRAAAKGMKPELFTKLEATLTKADTMIAKSALFHEIGSEVPGEAGDPEEEIAAKATEIQKSEKGLSPEVARARVLKGDPALARRVIAAHDQKIAAKRGN